MSDHNARESIRRGLEARTRSRGVSFGTPPSNEDIEADKATDAIKPVTMLSDLVNLAVESEAAHEGLVQLFDQTAESIAEDKARIIANLRHVGFSIAEAQNHPLAAGVLSQHVQGTNEPRMAALKVLLTNARIAEESAPLFSSPAAMLQTAHLLSDRKRQYTEALRNSGANELQAMAVKARAEGDPALASAVLTVADALPETMRKNLPRDFRNNLADHFMGEPWRQAQNALQIAKGRLRSAQLASNSFARTGRRSAESVLSHGLQKARERGAA